MTVFQLEVKLKAGAAQKGITTLSKTLRETSDDAAKISAQIAKIERPLKTSAIAAVNLAKIFKTIKLSTPAGVAKLTTDLNRAAAAAIKLKSALAGGKKLSVGTTGNASLTKTLAQLKAVQAQAAKSSLSIAGLGAKKASMAGFDGAISRLSRVQDGLSRINGQLLTTASRAQAAAAAFAGLSVPRVGAAVGGGVGRGVSRGRTGGGGGFNINGRRSRAAGSADGSDNAVFNTLAGTAIGGAVLQSANQYLETMNRVGLTVGSAAERQAVYNELLGIANKEYQDVTSVASFYQRISDASKTLGQSKEELLDFVATVQKAARVSGGAAESIKAALFQFSQGIGSGRVRGEELNSILEQFPLLADAAARQLEKETPRGKFTKNNAPLQLTNGSLKDFSEANGGIEAGVFIRALGSEEFKARLDNLAKYSQTTFSQAFNVIQNNFSNTIGKLGESSGAFSVITNSLLLFGQNLDKVLLLVGFLALRIGNNLLSSFIGAQVQGTLLGAALTGFGNAIIFASTTTASLGIRLLALPFQAVALTATAAGGAISRSLSNISIGGVQAKLNAVSASLNKLRQQSIRTTLREVGSGITTIAVAKVRALNVEMTKLVAKTAQLARSGTAAAFSAIARGATVAGAAVKRINFGAALSGVGAAAANAALAFFVLSDQITISGRNSATAFDFIAVASADMIDKIKEGAAEAYTALSGITTAAEDITFESIIINVASAMDRFNTIVADAISFVVASFFTGFVSIYESIYAAMSEGGNIILKFVNGAIQGINLLIQGANALGASFSTIQEYQTFEIGSKVNFEGTKASFNATADIVKNFGAVGEQEAILENFTKETIKGAEARNQAREDEAKLNKALAGDALKFKPDPRPSNFVKPKKTRKKKTGEEQGPEFFNRPDLLKETLEGLERELELVKLVGDAREVAAAKQAYEDKVRSNLERVNKNATREQINAMARLTIAEQSAIEAAVRRNREIERQIKLQEVLKERNTLFDQDLADLKAEEAIITAVGDEREVLTKILEIEKQTRQTLRDLYKDDKDIGEAEIERLARLTQAQKDRLEATVNTNLELQRQSELLAEIQQPGADVLNKTVALEGIKDKITPQQFEKQDTQNKLDQRQVNVDNGTGTFEDGFALALANTQERISSFSAAAGGTFGQFFTTIGDGFSETLGNAIFATEDLGESFKAVAREGITEVVTGLVKLGVQYAAQQALASILGTASTAQAVAQGTTIAAAYAPAAAATSAATFGGSAIAGAGALSTIAALAGSLFAGGFADGGYISGRGTSRSDSMLARVSNGEYVVNAAATAKNRPQLEAMNSGKTNPPTSVASQPIAVNITVNANDAASFGKSQNQIARETAAAIQRATRRG